MSATIYVVGNTYPHKHLLKAAGLRWDGAARAWIGTREQAERAVDGAEGMEIRGAEQAARVRSDADEYRAATTWTESAEMIAKRNRIVRIDGLRRRMTALRYRLTASQMDELVPYERALACEQATADLDEIERQIVARERR